MEKVLLGCAQTLASNLIISLGSPVVSDVNLWCMQGYRMEHLVI